MSHSPRPPALESPFEVNGPIGPEAVLRLVAGVPMPIAHTLPGQPERLFVNEAFTRAYGYTNEELPTQEAWFDTLYPGEPRRSEAIARWQGACAKAIEEGTDVPASEYILRAKDGSDRIVEISAAIIGDVVLGTLLDLTARRRSEARQRESEERFRSLVARIPVPLAFALEAGGNKLILNNSFKEAFGYDERDIPRIADWFELAYPDEDYRRQVMEAWGPLVEQARRTDGFIRPREYRVTCKDGSVRDVEISAVMLGESLAGLFQDNTERNRSARLLGELRDQLDHAGRISALGQLAASLAHELEQPLGAIFNNASAAEELLEKENSPHAGELRTILREILDDDVRAGAILDRIRSMVRKRKPRPQAVDLVSAMGEVLLLVGPEAASQGIRVEVALATGVPPVAIDAVLLQQALLNLLLNSIEALRGRESGWVRVEFQALGERGVAVSVADNGGGVLKEEEARLLEPFHSTKADGLGMGLPTVQSIVEEAGGSLFVENAPGVGFLVRLELPLWEGGAR
jgi:PAS domain S-box-containing protein